MGRESTAAHNQRACSHEPERREYAGSGDWYCAACGRFPMSAPAPFYIDYSDPACLCRLGGMGRRTDCPLHGEQAIKSALLSDPTATIGQ